MEPITTPFPIGYSIRVGLFSPAVNITLVFSGKVLTSKYLWLAYLLYSCSFVSGIPLLSSALTIGCVGSAI